MDPEVRDYVDAIHPDRRPLFDRVHGLVVEGFPDVEVVMNYKMPTYVVGDRRLHVAVWKHGLSFYGWETGRDGGFSVHHPTLVGDKGTIRIGPADAETITDDEFRAFLRDVLTD